MSEARVIGCVVALALLLPLGALGYRLLSHVVQAPVTTRLPSDDQPSCPPNPECPVCAPAVDCSESASVSGGDAGALSADLQRCSTELSSRRRGQAEFIDKMTEEIRRLQEQLKALAAAKASGDIKNDALVASLNDAMSQTQKLLDRVNEQDHHIAELSATAADSLMGQAASEACGRGNDPCRRKVAEVLKADGAKGKILDCLSSGDPPAPYIKSVKYNDPAPTHSLKLATPPPLGPTAYLVYCDSTLPEAGGR